MNNEIRPEFGDEVEAWDDSPEEFVRGIYVCKRPDGCFRHEILYDGETVVPYKRVKVIKKASTLTPDEVWVRAWCAVAAVDGATASAVTRFADVCVSEYRKRFIE